MVATAPGGLDLLAVADDGTLLATTTVLPCADLDTDAEARKARKDSARSTIWHTGMPVRFWDHEVYDLTTHLVLIGPDGDLRDLTPAVGTIPLRNASADLAPDASAVATTWTQRVRGGDTRTSIVLIDTATAERRTFVADPDSQYGTPVFSRDGTHLAVTRFTVATDTHTTYPFLEIHPVGAGEAVTVDVGDLPSASTCGPIPARCWSPAICIRRARCSQWTRPPGGPPRLPTAECTRRCPCAGTRWSPCVVTWQPRPGRCCWPGWTEQISLMPAAKE